MADSDDDCVVVVEKKKSIKLVPRTEVGKKREVSGGEAIGSKRRDAPRAEVELANNKDAPRTELPKEKDTKASTDLGGGLSDLLRAGESSDEPARKARRHGFTEDSPADASGESFLDYCRTAAAAIEAASSSSSAIVPFGHRPVMSLPAMSGPSVLAGLGATAAAAIPMLPRSKKRKKDDQRIGSGCQGAGEAAQLRGALFTAAGPMGDGLSDVNRLQEAIMAFVGLFSLGETEALGDLAAACSQAGNLEALRILLAQLSGPIAPSGQSGRSAITFPLYQRVCDHICLSTHTEFVPAGLMALVEARFAPVQSEFSNDDVLQYFARGQHFLSLEFAEDMRALIEQGKTGIRCTTCKVSNAIPKGYGKGWNQVTEGMFDVSPQPGQRWHTKADRFRDFGHFQHGAGEGPGRGDVVFLWQDHVFCIGIVQSGAGRAGGNITVAVQQVPIMKRCLAMQTNGTTMVCAVGPSKVALDRMRSALVDLCRKTTQVPAMQWWLIHRRPTPVREWEDDDFKSLKMHLRLRPRDGESQAFDSSAAVATAGFKPGKITGELLFQAVNPTGMRECSPAEASGKILVFWRGAIRPEEQAKNAAAGGAVGVALVDDDEGIDEGDNSGDQVGCVFINFPAGESAGLTLSTHLGNVVVTAVEPGSKAVGKVFEGDVVIEVNGSKIRNLDLWKKLLSQPQEEPPSAFFKTQPPNERAAVPVVLVRREDGHRMMLAAMSGGTQPIPPLAEIVISEYGPAGEPDMKMNKPQMEAIQAALSPIMKQKQGRVSLIQGPPGTGKTTVALQIIERWLQKPDMQVDDSKNAQVQKKILVTGFSNIAIDNIAMGLQKMELGPLLRIGRGQTILSRDTIQDRMLEHPSYMELEALRGSRFASPSSGADIFKLERKISRDLIQRAKIICATCVTAGGDMLAGFNFRRVLFDEATQATEPASVVPISKGCEELVLIGDHKQLPPLIHNSSTLDLGLHESLFERLRRLGVPTKLLSVQYRMHPAIAAFPSYTFYSSKLSNGLGPEARRAPLGYYWPDPSAPLCFEGIGDEDALLEEKQGTSLQNKTECYRVNQIVEGLLNAGDVPASEIAVLTPYAAQASLLKSQLRSKGVVAATVDSYQGRETDVVICSTVRCAPKRGVGFLSDKRRFNVLLTRARRGLIVCGHEATLRLDPCWKDWIEHVAQHRLWNGTFGEITQEKQSERTQHGVDQEEADMSRVPKEKLSGPGNWMGFSDGMWPAAVPEAGAVSQMFLGGNAAGAAPETSGEAAEVTPENWKNWASSRASHEDQPQEPREANSELSAAIEAAAQSARKRASATWRNKALVAAAQGPGPSALMSLRVKHLLVTMGNEIPAVQFSEHGPPRCRVFHAVMQLPGTDNSGMALQAKGVAGNKKDAERHCYENAWKVLVEDSKQYLANGHVASTDPKLARTDEPELVLLNSPNLALTNTPANDSVLQDLMNLGVDMQSLVQGSSSSASCPPMMQDGSWSAASSASSTAPGVGPATGKALGWLKQKLSKSRLWWPPGQALPLQMAEEGPPHQRTFTCTLMMPLRAGPQTAVGQARTKKEAERLCCEHAVNMLSW